MVKLERKIPMEMIRILPRDSNDILISQVKRKVNLIGFELILNFIGLDIGVLRLKLRKF
jgi:hypothetical protein